MIDLQTCFNRLTSLHPVIATLKLGEPPAGIACFDHETKEICMPARATVTTGWLLILMHEYRHALQNAESEVREEYEEKGQYYFDIEKDADVWALVNVEEIFADVLAEFDAEEVQEEFYHFYEMRDEFGHTWPSGESISTIMIVEESKKNAIRTAKVFTF